MSHKKAREFAIIGWLGGKKKMENELFETAQIKKAYFKLALPVVFSMVISLVYNMVDTFFIAQTQNTNLVAGVSLCAPLFSLMVAFGDVFGLGGSSVLSRLFGQKKDQEGKRVSGFCFYSAILFGIVVALIMILFKNPILALLGANQDTYQYAHDYFFYITLGAPIIILSLTPGNLMRTEGLAMEAMIGTVAGSIANIILDPIFIFGLNMQAGGAAIATVLGNLVTDLILVYFILKRSKKLTVDYKETKIPTQYIKEIIAIGIPASLTNMMQSFSMTLMNRYLIQYGTSKVAAMGIAMKVSMIVMLVMVGFAFGAQPLLGYNYGAKNYRRLKEVIRFDFKVEGTFSIIMVILLGIFSKQIVHIFMSDSQIIQDGSLMLICLLLSMPFAGMILIYTTLFQASSKALPAFILSISRQGVVFALVIVIVSTLFGYYGTILTQVIADVISVTMAYIMYKKSVGKEIKNASL